MVRLPPGLGCVVGPVVAGCCTGSESGAAGGGFDARPLARALVAACAPRSQLVSRRSFVSAVTRVRVERTPVPRARALVAAHVLLSSLCFVRVGSDFRVEHAPVRSLRDASSLSLCLFIDTNTTNYVVGIFLCTYCTVLNLMREKAT